MPRGRPPKIVEQEREKNNYKINSYSFFLFKCVI